MAVQRDISRKIEKRSRWTSAILNRLEPFKTRPIIQSNWNTALKHRDNCMITNKSLFLSRELKIFKYWTMNNNQFSPLNESLYRNWF